MLVALASYYVGESLGASGVTSLIVCALWQAQYSWYNLSPQGKHASGVTVATMGFLAETYVFTIIGLGVMQYWFTWWVPYFAVACFFIIFFARFVAVMSLHYLVVCCGGRNAFNFKELCFFSLQGNIKGAIALGFIVKYEKSITYREECITTMMFLVVSSVLIYGSLLPCLAKSLLGEKEAQCLHSAVFSNQRSFNDPNEVLKA